MKHHLWYRGLKTKKEKEERQRELSGYRTAYDELIELLNTQRKSPAVRDYGSPGWANQQIAVNEWNHALDAVINLIKEG